MTGGFSRTLSCTTLPSRRGSLVPWSLRLLLAELPHYLGRTSSAVNRLFGLLATIRRMLDNVRSGLALDGELWLAATPAERDTATTVWKVNKNAGIEKVPTQLLPDAGS